MVSRCISIPRFGLVCIVSTVLGITVGSLRHMDAACSFRCIDANATCLSSQRVDHMSACLWGWYHSSGPTGPHDASQLPNAYDDISEPINPTYYCDCYDQPGYKKAHFAGGSEWTTMYCATDCYPSE